MDIRQVSQKEKDKYIKHCKSNFTSIKKMMKTLEEDMKSDDLMIQASSVWVSGNLVNWFNDFLFQIKNLHLQKNEIQNEIKNIAENKEKSHLAH